MSLRVLIADDEPLAREGLLARLADEPAVEAVGECCNGRQTLAAIDRCSPDLLLLDVEMPGLDGLALLSRLPEERRPLVVFVSAYGRYALPAFDFEPVDYLLKPVDGDRLHVALERARRRCAERRLAGDLGRLLDRNEVPEASDPPAAADRSWLRRLAVKGNGRIRFVEVAELDWIEAAGDYVYLHAGRHRHLIRDSLARLEERLDPGKFQRIHRGTIVRLDRIAELHPLGRGEYRIRLTGGAELKLSRTYRETLERSLGVAL